MTKSYKKICPKCGCQSTKKDGTRKGRQSYRCKQCGHVWVTGRRKKSFVDKELLYEDFALHKQTYLELTNRYGISKRSVQKYLDEYSIGEDIHITPTEIILLIDTTYFGSIGLMVFKDAYNKDILHYEIVIYETNEGYKRGIEHIQKQGWVIKAIVCDGRRGLLGGFKDIPTQMCHFHQVQIIRRYITKKPILKANKELKEIVNWLARTDKQCFEAELERWYKKHKEFLQEKGVNDEGKQYYKHRRTRSAYYSLKRNLKYLFVYQDYMGKLDIPNTTNGLEAVFSHLKCKVNLHRGLRGDRKLKLIKYLLLSR